MTEKCKEVVAQLRRQMNGAVSHSMRDGGNSEPLNFGVSLPTIRQIAAPYAPDNALAAELAAMESREARIAALYIADDIDTPAMELWSARWQSEELARLSAMVLFWRSHEWRDVATMWLHDSELRRIAALYIVGRRAADVDDELGRAAVAAARNDAATVYALRELYGRQPSLRPAISAIAPQIDDLEWQIG